MPSRMLRLQFILSTLELGLKENGEIKEVRSSPFQLCRFTGDHHVWRRAQEHYEFRFLLTRSTRSPSWFIYTRYVEVHVELSCTDAYSVACNTSFLMRACGCVSASVYAHLCVYVFGDLCLSALPQFKRV